MQGVETSLINELSGLTNTIKKVDDIVQFAQEREWSEKDFCKAIEILHSMQKKLAVNSKTLEPDKERPSCIRIPLSVIKFDDPYYSTLLFKDRLATSHLQELITQVEDSLERQLRVLVSINQSSQQIVYRVECLAREWVAPIPLIR